MRVRDRFRSLLTAKPRPLHILMVIIFIVFGMAITTQIRATVANPLEGLSEDELVTLLADLQQREDELRATRSELQLQLGELQDAATSQQAARELAERSAIQSQILAGSIPVSGPGIILWVTPGDNAISASAFVSTVAELRNGGAEAIELNETRLNSTAWFGEENGKLLLNGVPLTMPYVWRAIGDPHTLEMALEIRGGVVDQLKAFGANVSLSESDEITIENVVQQPTPVWAEIAPAD